MTSLLQRRAPDPARAHGAWVYLLMSVLAGALTGSGRGLVSALFAGLGFVGVFLVASSMAIYPHRWVGRFVAGAGLAAGSTALGLTLGADPMFFAYASTAAFPAGASIWFAVRHGFQSPPALAFGVVALVIAAPSAACAGGASPKLGWLLLVLLAPFFAWRTWRTRNLLFANSGWTREKLRAVGLREALLAGLWTLAAVVIVHLAGMWWQ